MPIKDKAKQAEAAARHYQQNKQVMKERAAKALALARLRNREYVSSRKTEPCLDCGVAYPPHVMQFDHVTGVKLFNVSDGINRGMSIARLAEEIEKCEVVCANCHAERTYQRSSLSDTV